VAIEPACQSAPTELAPITNPNTIGLGTLGVDRLITIALLAAGMAQHDELLVVRTPGAHAHVQQALTRGLFDVLAEVPVLGPAEPELVEVGTPEQPAYVDSTARRVAQDMHYGAVGVVGQALEGYVLSPKLVGPKVGLHPVWLIFALLAFGYLFGFVGLLVAVPLAATFGVLSRFALRRYLESSLYTGEGAG
jgi:hypothetical protein